MRVASDVFRKADAGRRVGAAGCDAVPRADTARPVDALRCGCAVRRVGILAALCCVLVALVLMTGCTGASSSGYVLAEAGTLTVATASDRAPYAQGGEADLDGYDVAFARALADRLGLACTVHEVEAGHEVAAVADGSCDVAVSALSSERNGAEGISFSDPYCLVDQALVTLGGTYKGADSLGKLKVAVCEGSVGSDLADEWGATPVAYKDAASCLKALTKGSVSAAVMDEPVARSLISRGQPSCGIALRIASSERYRVALADGNASLNEDINEAIKAMEADGTLDDLRKRYF